MEIFHCTLSFLLFVTFGDFHVIQECSCFHLIQEYRKYRTEFTYNLLDFNHKIRFFTNLLRRI